MLFARLSVRGSLKYINMSAKMVGSKGDQLDRAVAVLGDVSFTRRGLRNGHNNK